MARTEPRFTRDADLAVAVASDAEAEPLIHTLRARDYGIEAVMEQDAMRVVAARCGAAPSQRFGRWCTRKSTTRSNGSKPYAAATDGRRFELALMS